MQAADYQQENRHQHNTADRLDSAEMYEGRNAAAGEAAEEADLTALGGGSSSSNEPARPPRFLAKVYTSCVLWLASGAYVVISLSNGRSQMSSVHPALLMLLIAVVYVVVFYCEGLKIAIVGTAHCSR